MSSVYTLLLASLFFLWPVVSGIEGVSIRLIWLAIAAASVVCSSYQFERAWKTSTYSLSFAELPWKTVLPACLIVLFATTQFPPLLFSDELTIAIPGITAVRMVSDILSPAGALMLLCVTLLAGFAAWKYLPWKASLILCFLLIGISGVMAFVLPTSGIATRYPPLVHLVQSVVTILTLGVPSLLRAPNVLWTALLIIFLWKMLPRWSTPARLATALCIMTGPLGWTYRVTLMQACGELTLGLVAILLAHHVLTSPKNTEYAALLGGVLGLWFLYRPSSLVATVALLCIFLALRRWTSARVVAGVALPVTLAWLTLAPLYASHYGLGEDTVNTLNPLLSLISAASMLPSNFHPLLLAFLLLSSCVAWITSDRWHRQLLLLAWAVALPVAIVHHGIAGQVCIICIGVARYNILLLLPAALSVGCLLVGRKGVLPPLLAITTVLVSLYLTPFSFVEFTQKQRIPGSDIMHTPTEGYLPGPVIPASAQLLQEYPESLIIVAPQYGFLDWFAARGLASLPNLKELQKRSMSWDPSSPLRPVVIQAPVTTTYLPSITQEQEQRLKEIRTWARKQPSHTTIQFGTEEIIIVH